VETGRESHVTFRKDLISQRITTSRWLGTGFHILPQCRGRGGVPAALRQYLSQQQPDFPDTLGQSRTFHRGITMRRL